MIKIASQSQLLKGFFTNFWASWVSKCFCYLCLIFVVMFIMPSNFCTQLVTIKAQMSLAYILALFSSFFEQEITTAKQWKYANERNTLNYAVIWVENLNTVQFITNTKLFSSKAQYSSISHFIQVIKKTNCGLKLIFSKISFSWFKV